MAIKRDRTMELARLTAHYINHPTAENMDKLTGNILALIKSADAGTSWVNAGTKLLQWLDSGMQSQVPFNVFIKGNGKLPFWSFSSLPVVLCPGAGDCVNWCYSLKAWRYPFAFFRQLQNSLLIGAESEQLAQAFKALPNGEHVRLYVDGDFHSVQSVRYWWSLLIQRPDLQAYGYSKSLELIIEAAATMPPPVNYVLNISSGSNASAETINKAKRLSITRGEFIALEQGEQTEKEMLKAYKQTTKRPAFLCPGECGSCTAKVHACGSLRFKGVDVIIAIH